MDPETPVRQRLSLHPGILMAGILGISLIACASILARSLVRTRSSHEIIRVTGSARRAIRSDFIIWRSRITEDATALPEAYARLKKDEAKVKAYLVSKGIDAGEVFPLAIDAKVLFKDPRSQGGVIAGDAWGSREGWEVRGPAIGYRLTQAVEVRSKAVDRVDGVARLATELISTGVPVVSEAPEYIYQNLGELKHEMLAEAAKDARIRADRIAQNCGCRAGELRFARMGVLQIQGLYDSEGVTDSGANDTLSLDKRITAIVGAEFSIAR